MSTHVSNSTLHVIPKTMQAAVIERFGGPEVFSLKTLPVAMPDPNEVLIAVNTSGVGSWDADIRKGWSPSGLTHFPLILGTEGSGVIARVGSHVRRFHVGDKVYAYTWDNPKGGFYAEYVAALSDNVAHIPKPLDIKHAGAIPVTGLTALQGIDDVLHLKKDQTVIIHGASGGVGTLAIQFAKLRGARVFATALGKDGVKLARELGADMTVDGHDNDISAAARQFDPNGVDAVLALVGGDALEHCMEAIRPGGRLAYPNGIEPEPTPRGKISVISYDGKAGVREFEHLGRAVETARPKVVIAAEYPLAEVARAHERLAQGHVFGKIVLRVRGG